MTYQRNTPTRFATARPYQERFRASGAFPVETDETFIVRGVGGEPDETWRIGTVRRDEKGRNTYFSAEITEHWGVR